MENVGKIFKSPYEVLSCELYDENDKLLEKVTIKNSKQNIETIGLWKNSSNS